MKTAVIITGRNANEVIETMTANALGALGNNVFFASKKEADYAIDNACINVANNDTIEVNLLVQEEQPTFETKKVLQSSINSDSYLQEIFA